LLHQVGVTNHFTGDLISL